MKPALRQKRVDAAGINGAYVNDIPAQDVDYKSSMHAIARLTDFHPLQPGQRRLLNLLGGGRKYHQQ